MTVTGTITHATCDASSDASITQTINGGATPYVFQWDNGLPPTQNQTNLDDGTYNVTINPGTCQETAAYIITATPNVSISSTVTQHESCPGANDGEISVTVTGGTTPYVYDWDIDGAGDNDDAEDQTGLIQGTYNLTVNPGVCEDNISEAITVTPALTVSSAIVQHESCVGASDGEISVTVTGGTTPYVYDWDIDGTGDNDDAEDQTGLIQGTYNLTVNPGVCEDNISEAITVTPALTVSSAIVQHESCVGASDGEISVTVTGGATPYVYDWDIDGTGDNDDAEDQTGLIQGTYNLTVNPGVCEDNTTEIITVTPALTVSSAIVQHESCVGASDGEISVTVTGGTTPYVYDWDIDGAGDNDDAEDQTGLIQGTYNLTVNPGVCEDNISEAITVTPALTVSSTIVQHESCPGANDGEISVTVTGGTTPYVYDWDIDGAGDNDDAEDQTGLIQGTYNLTVNPGVCEDNISEAITVTPALTVSSAIVQHESCVGASDGEISVTVTGGTTPYVYDWDIDGAGDNDDAEDQTGLIQGTYNLTVNPGVCEDNISEAITVTPALTVSSAIVQHESCVGASDGEISVTVTGGATPYVYDWDIDGTGDNDDAEDQTGLIQGTYNLTVNPGVCEDNTTEIITVTPALTVSSAIVQHESCVGASDGEISVTVTGGTTPYVYDWDIDGTGDNDDAEDQTGLIQGTYNLTVNPGVCEDNISEAITVTPALTVSSTIVQHESCPGANDGEISVTVTGGTTPYVYDWDIDGTGDNDDAEDQTGLIQGTYNLTVNPGVCEDNISEAITVTPALTVSSAIVQHESCVGASDGEISVTVTGGTTPYVYDWDIDGTGDNDDAEDQTGLIQGTYNLTVNPGVCEDNISEAITVTPALTVSSAIVQHESCVGASDGEISVTVTGGATPYVYDWDIDGTGDNDDAEDQTGLIQGTYNLTVNPGVCEDNTTEIITVTPPKCYSDRYSGRNMYRCR